MTYKKRKPTYSFSFRTSQKTAELLKKEGNKSDIINKALVLYYKENLIKCDSCKGRGTILKTKKIKVVLKKRIAK